MEIYEIYDGSFNFNRETNQMEIYLPTGESIVLDLSPEKLAHFVAEYYHTSSKLTEFLSVLRQLRCLECGGNAGCKCWNDE